MPIAPLPPHLIELNNQKVCSVCKTVISPENGSMSKAFRTHVEQHHMTKPTIRKEVARALKPFRHRDKAL